MSITSTLVKFAKLPTILEAAKVLYDNGLIKLEPHEVIRIYLRKNPDINEALTKIPVALLP